MKTRVELEYPVTVNGEETTELFMRRPKVRDERDARRAAGRDATDAEREIVLLSNLCEVAPEALYELDMADYERLQKAFTDFFPKASPKEKPSGGRP